MYTEEEIQMAVVQCKLMKSAKVLPKHFTNTFVGVVTDCLTNEWGEQAGNPWWHEVQEVVEAYCVKRQISDERV